MTPTSGKLIGLSIQSGGVTFALREDIMPITGTGWELHMIRTAEQRKWNDRYRIRTVGRYQVYHDGTPQNRRYMRGMFAETRGPGDNSRPGNNRRIEEGTYTLHTQGGTKYKTIGYSESGSTNAQPKPGIELKGCRPRTEILIHPGRGFLSSVGCINPCTSLPNGTEPITYSTSRLRTIALLEDLKAYLGDDFPTRNERTVPRSFVVIDGEPSL
jgi:hypothetical protein